MPETSAVSAEAETGTPRSPSPPPIRSALIYAMNYAPELTGAGRYTGEIGEFLAAEGVKLEVVTTPPHYPGWRVQAPFSGRWYSTDSYPSISVTRCPLVLRREDIGGIWRLVAPLSFALTSAPVVIWKILRHRPDVVLCIEPTLLAAPAALIAARLVGARRVLHVQDLEIDAAFAVGHLQGTGLRNLALRLERIMLSPFDRVITISGQMMERLADKGIPREQLAVVRNWVDLDRIGPTAGKNAFRTELGIGEDEFVVLYAGNIGRKQALHVMLQAAERMQNERGITFVVAGEGPEKRALLTRFSKLPNVRFLPIQPENRLRELLSLASLHILPQEAGMADLVLPSKLGGMLASGRPVLACAAPGTELHDFLKGTAILIAPGDSEAMAAEIAVLARTGEHPALGNGRALAQTLSRNINLAAFRDLISH